LMYLYYLDKISFPVRKINNKYNNIKKGRVNNAIQKNIENEKKLSQINTRNCSCRVRAVRVLENKDIYFQIVMIHGKEKWFVWR
jgi:hypothetical protein